MHVLAHSPFRHRAVWQFLTQAHPDPVRRVPLLPGCLAISLQDLVNKGNRCLQFRVGPFPFFRGLGKALAIASRTIRRCTFTFLATPAIVPPPNSYYRRISSNSSTLALHSNGLPLAGYGPIQGIRSLPRWAIYESGGTVK